MYFWKEVKDSDNKIKAKCFCFFINLEKLLVRFDRVNTILNVFHEVIVDIVVEGTRAASACPAS